MSKTDTIAAIRFWYTSTFRGGLTWDVEIRVQDFSATLWRHRERLARLRTYSLQVPAAELQPLCASFARYRNAGAEFAIESRSQREYVIASPYQLTVLLEDLHFAHQLTFRFYPGGTPLEPKGEVIGAHLAFIRQRFDKGFGGERVRRYA